MRLIERREFIFLGPDPTMEPPGNELRKDKRKNKFDFFFFFFFKLHKTQTYAKNQTSFDLGIVNRLCNV